MWIDSNRLHSNILGQSSCSYVFDFALSSTNCGSVSLHETGLHVDHLCHGFYIHARHVKIYLLIISYMYFAYIEDHRFLYHLYIRAGILLYP